MVVSGAFIRWFEKGRRVHCQEVECDGIVDSDGGCRCEGGLWWELDFSADPTTLDVNGDDVADWHLRDESDFDVEDSLLMVPDFYDNTVVCERSTWALRQYSDVGGILEGGGCHGNEVYNTVDAPSANGIFVGDTRSDFDSTNNHVYLRSASATCMTTSGQDSGNTCTKGYTGAVPDSRQGAGLLP